MATSAILNFGQIAFLITWYNWGFYFVPSYEIWAECLNTGRRYGCFSNIQDSGRAPFWDGSDVTRPPTLSISQCHWCLKISCKYFGDINIFFEMARNCPTIPQFEGFRGNLPLNVVGHPVDPKKLILALFRVIWAIVRQNRPTGHFSIAIPWK